MLLTMLNSIQLKPSRSLELLLAFAIVLKLASAPTNCQQQQEQSTPKQANPKHHNVHLLMSDSDLRRTFQVDSHDRVPEYEVLKFTINRDGSHLVTSIQDAKFSTSTDSQATNSNTDTDTNTNTDANTNTNKVNVSAERHKRLAEGESANDQHQQLDDLIVMNLSTFDTKFKLRLKRNTDFQERIKDMKMFMAESTQDGQLHYTEIKSSNGHQPSHHGNHHGQRHHGHQQQHHHQHHSRPPTANDAEPSEPEPASADEPHRPQTRPSAGKQQLHFDNIGLTYHDEQNLAALLIERDRTTGQLQVDGTIGNDFVIKPLPQATIEALARRQQQSQPAAEALTSAATMPKVEAAQAPTPAAPVASQESQLIGERLASQLHNDDPHDDDEMFLDEDEALEMAHQMQLSRGLSEAAPANQTSVAAASSPSRRGDDQAAGPAESPAPRPHQHQAAAGGAPRKLSKAATERKWREYRKLMARTQVPKVGSLRARRQAPAPEEPPRGQLQVAHHIVYRLRPTAEGSSPEHQHSFMLAPGQQSMEEMARRFAPLGRGADREPARARRQAAHWPGPDNSLNEVPPADQRDETDFAPDPMGGQFYLEPGAADFLGSESLSADWLLVRGGAGAPMRASGLVAPPPYALNGTSSSSPDPELDHHQDRLVASNMTAAGPGQAHARYRRHLRQAPAGRAAGRPAPAPSSAVPQVRRKRQAPDTVWPEVLLVVDYDSFLLHGGDSRDVKRYFVSFWNGVDLRYKLLVHPHIRISLAGMIVAKDRDATPYLERNRLRAPNADAVDAAGALTDMGKYLYREDRLPTYDLAVVITKLDMCRRRYEGGRCNRGTAGFAYVGGACVVNKRLEKVNSVAIIEDSGGFSGIIVAAHEVGHLLGCVHDGSPPPSYLGGPGATHCPWEDGFIMSDLRHTERGFRWSQCSVEQFKHFLNGETATCLYNYPHESQMLHRLLPGTMLSLDEQCKRDRGTNACFKDARVCAQLFCFDSASGYCVSYRPAAEGSPCGEGQVCRNGKCVGEIENIIPDYTHQSQTIVARRPNQLVAAASSAPVTVVGAGGPLAALPTSRLADNGLSASSTSTATSSPESQSEAPGSGQQQALAGNTNRRMDTFALDSPAASGPLGPQQVARQQVHPSGRLHQHQSHKNAKLLAAGPQSAPDGTHLQPQQQQQQRRQPTPTIIINNNNNNNSAYQQRSGHLAPVQPRPSPPGASQGPRRSYAGTQQPVNSSPVIYHRQTGSIADQYTSPQLASTTIRAAHEQQPSPTINYADRNTNSIGLHEAIRLSSSRPMELLAGESSHLSPYSFLTGQHQHYQLQEAAAGAS